MGCCKSKGTKKKGVTKKKKATSSTSKKPNDSEPVERALSFPIFLSQSPQAKNPDLAPTDLQKTTNEHTQNNSEKSSATSYSSHVSFSSQPSAHKSTTTTTRGENSSESKKMIGSEGSCKADSSSAPIEIHHRVGALMKSEEDISLSFSNLMNDIQVSSEGDSVLWTPEKITPRRKMFTVEKSHHTQDGYQEKMTSAPYIQVATLPQSDSPEPSPMLVSLNKRLQVARTLNFEANENGRE